MRIQKLPLVAGEHAVDTVTVDCGYQCQKTLGYQMTSTMDISTLLWMRDITIVSCGRPGHLNDMTGGALKCCWSPVKSLPSACTHRNVVSSVFNVITVTTVKCPEQTGHVKTAQVDFALCPLTSANTDIDIALLDPVPRGQRLMTGSTPISVRVSGPWMRLSAPTQHRLGGSGRQTRASCQS
ncbi:hypothetical protein RRG08_022403 [Elysia crispata]|uniref:Uncharacterized protein n=1 Tax=Elysia crispata TaxID=231223 RepID=A0AAE1D8A2_9GAST|nr:hypothetical protein RRG08_022403 [Elysia crispata]